MPDLTIAEAENGPAPHGWDDTASTWEGAVAAGWKRTADRWDPETLTLRPEQSTTPEGAPRD